MRLFCKACGKGVSNELPKETVVRATIFCLDCSKKMNDKLDKILELVKR
jgi:hypothetical protein